VENLFMAHANLVLETSFTCIETPEPPRIQRRDLARTRKPFLPLLGERAGVRADFFMLTSLFGLMVRGIFFVGVRLLQTNANLSYSAEATLGVSVV
jgi:hypothetical protein